MSVPKGRRRPIPEPLRYSAEIVRSDGDRIRLYTDGQKSRTETTVAEVTTISLWRPDLGRSYRVDWDNQTYTTYPITAEMEAMGTMDIEDDVEWEHVTSEPFGLRTVDVYDVFVKGTARRRARMYVDSETQIRWKEVTFNKLGKEVLTIEMKNVEIGPPPASVFDLPAGLREFRPPE